MGSTMWGQNLPVGLLMGLRYSYDQKRAGGGGGVLPPPDTPRTINNVHLLYSVVFGCIQNDLE